MIIIIIIIIVVRYALASVELTFVELDAIP